MHCGTGVPYLCAHSDCHSRSRIFSHRRSQCTVTVNGDLVVVSPCYAVCSLHWVTGALLSRAEVSGEFRESRSADWESSGERFSSRTPLATLGQEQQLGRFLILDSRMFCSFLCAARGGVCWQVFASVGAAATAGFRFNSCCGEDPVWVALKVLDEAGDDLNSVIDIYSLKKVAKSLQGKPDGWNREHLWPHSYGLEMGRPEFSDLHNLRPSDVNVNSSRGNKVFGECMMTMKNPCFVPANKEAAPDTGTNKDIWMPPAQVRGDVARALMYMAVRYGSDQPAGSPLLQLSNSPAVGSVQMGLLSDLLFWNEVDPPSEVEQLRNMRVCTLYQHNRNPFVDHPEYAKSIWEVTGSPSTDERRTHAGSLEEKTDAWINEFHYDNEGVDENEEMGAYGSLPLADGTIFSRGKGTTMGFSLFVAKIPSGTLQNGPRDAIALVKEDSTSHVVHVLQFLSYEGSFKALNGPAEGLQSLDIIVKEGPKTPRESSLGLSGSGHVYRDFQWAEARKKASPGSWNWGQTLSFDCDSKYCIVNPKNKP